MSKFPEGSVRSSHYVDHPQGRRHDADMAKLETAHKRHHDLGMNTEPEHQSHNPDQANYEHTHPDQVSPSIADGESQPLKGL